MPASDLVSYSQVQAYAGTLAASTSQVVPLIAQVSRQILSKIQRPRILPSTFTETRDGDGGRRMLLLNYPVLAVSSVIIDGIPIPAAAANASGVSPGSGWLLEAVSTDPPGRPAGLSMRGYEFRRGWQNVTATYTAGYQVSGEAWTVPSSSPYQVMVTAPFGAWGNDQGVTFTGGAALTLVTGVPSAGQYAVSIGVYTFAAADAGKAVSISYGYVPFDLSLAAAQWVAESIAYTGHIGQASKTLGGQETVSYKISAVPMQVDALIQPYKRVVML